MTRFVSTLVLTVTLIGAAAGAAYAKPDRGPDCTIDGGYNRIASCEVGG